MKVLHVETGRHLYGGALQVRYLLDGLHAKGVDNLLLCPAGSAIAEAAGASASVHAVPMRGEADVTFAWRMWRLLSQEKPDLLHIHSRRGADLWGSMVARLSPRPAILTRRVDNPEPGWLARWKYRPFQRVITISGAIRRVLVDEGLEESRVVCVHSALEASAYQGASDPEWFHREFDFPAGSRVVGIVAQLIERKGHRYLIEAAPGILRGCPETHFLVLGQGPERERLESLCRANGLAAHFRFAGFRNDLPRILPNLALVAHPALMEGLGIALLQASACGVPIVAARAGGIPEVVRDGINGLLVAPGQADPLRDAILSLLGSPRLYAELQVGGPRLVAETFSIDAMVAGNLRQYHEVLAARPPAPVPRG